MAGLMRTNAVCLPPLPTIFMVLICPHDRHLWMSAHWYNCAESPASPICGSQIASIDQLVGSLRYGEISEIPTARPRRVQCSAELRSFHRFDHRRLRSVLPPNGPSSSGSDRCKVSDVELYRPGDLGRFHLAVGPAPAVDTKTDHAYLEHSRIPGTQAELSAMPVSAENDLVVLTRQRRWSAPLRLR